MIRSANPSKNAIRQREWRQKTKQMLVEGKGGKCSKCGYDKCIGALDFHHPDGEEKKDRSILMNIRSLDKVLADADPLILLCANCHREEHYYNDYQGN
jgi:DNA-directed RNA polymerase subunit M/transcription elongation factor TFIIS